MATEIFVVPLLLWLGGTVYWIHQKFFRGKLGHALREREVQEELAKLGVLSKHGLEPDERNRRTKFFGMFSYLDDDLKFVDEEDFKDEQ